MSWVIAVVSFVLLAMLRKRSKPSFLWIIVAALAAIGGAAFFATGLGGWVTGLSAGLLGWLGGLFGASATQLAGGVVLILVIAIVLDIAVDRRADRVAVAGLIALPMLIVIASGPVANGVSEFYEAVGTAGESSVGRLVGG